VRASIERVKKFMVIGTLVELREKREEGMRKRGGGGDFEK